MIILSLDSRVQILLDQGDYDSRAETDECYWGEKGGKPNYMRLVKSYSEKERQPFPIKYE